MSAPESGREGVELTHSLLLELRSGGSRAAELLERAWRRPLLRYTQALLGDAHEAEDAVQDVFARVLASRSFPDSFRAWVYRIARNLCLNRLRARRPRALESALGEDSPRAPSHTGDLARLVRAEASRQLEADLAALSAAQREALLLRYAEGLSREEVAEVLDLPPALVKSRIHEGLERLRKLARARGSSSA